MFNQLKVEGARTRSDHVKNLSLTLLNAHTPQDVLEIFSKDILNVDVANPGQNQRRVVSVEELLIVLHFFKAHLRDLHEQDVQSLFETDFRVKQLTAMTFERYEEAKKSLEFTYQVSAVHSFAYLHKMHSFELSDAQKDLLVEALAQSRAEDATQMLTEVPSLVFMLHILQTEYNRDSLIEAVAKLSGLFLDMIGERIDGIGCSNLLSGWAELGFRDEQLFDRLAEIMVDKMQREAVFVKGDSTAVVNILKAMNSLQLDNEDFLTGCLEFLVDNFDEL